MSTKIKLSPFGPNKEQAFQLAQLRANSTSKPCGVWEHVGDYGRPGGDIEARHTFSVRSLDLPDLPRDWALIGTADPDEVEEQEQEQAHPDPDSQHDRRRNGD